MTDISSGGDGSADVGLIADELSHAVELTLDPSVDHNARTQAYNACESFKENSPWCAQTGLRLASSPQYSAVVKHFGLQLMENSVKYRWLNISQAEKMFIKENAMTLLCLGGYSETHLNDALARIIVEMVKREWPQQWPALLSELSDACSRGHQQTQIVLHVFLRLVEDVATLQTLEQNQRRKDIYQALTSNMAEIFAFFMRLIELHVQEFREKTAAGDFAAAESNGRVVQVVLLTLTGFVEWVSINHMVVNNGRLLQILCILLEDDSFQMSAVECLLQIVNRKGSTKERKPLTILFNREAIECIHRATTARITNVDEKGYLFLKKVSQVLVGIGQQLTTLWNASNNVDNANAWIPLLLDIMLLMCTHPSLTLVHTVCPVWVSFMKHEQISRAQGMVAVITQLAHALFPKIIKVTYPSSRPTGAKWDTEWYACMDYDNELDFAAFFCRCRTDILEVYKHCMVLAPQVTWHYVSQFTKTALGKVNECPASLDFSHPLYLEWEAVSQVLEVVVSRVLVAEPRPGVADGLALLERCVVATPPCPHLLSLLLSFISALFVFLSMASCQLAGVGAGTMGAELLPRVLDKIFGALVYTDASSDGRPRSRATKNLRRHAASLLVKLGYKYPLVLLPVLDRLLAASRAVLARADLSTVESVTLQEALLLISNHLCDYHRQKILVAEVLGDYASHWQQMSPHLASTDNLIQFIGLHVPPSDADDVYSHARRVLIHSLTLVLGVVKRTAVPDDPEKASRGGFSAGVTPSGNPVWRNPCSEYILPILPLVLTLTHHLHALHAPTTRLHPDHGDVLSPPLAEVNNLLGLRDQELPPLTPAQRVQQFMYTLQDTVYHLIAASASSLGREFYNAMEAGVLESSLLPGLYHLPLHRLKSLIRVVLRPIIHHCPPSHYNKIALPLLEPLTPYMFFAMTRLWSRLEQLRQDQKDTGGDRMEILEDVLGRCLTREYVDLLKVTLVGGTPNGDGAAAADEEEPAGAGAAQRAAEHVSELGALVMSHKLGRAALHTLLSVIECNDTLSSLRASGLAGAAVRAALAGGRLQRADAERALAATFAGLARHGQHDANQAALLALSIQTYESLRPHFPGIRECLLSLPNVEEQDVIRLDEKLLATPSARPGKIDKGKRDLYKKLVIGVIGKNIGQKFKKKVCYIDLPNMAPNSKGKSTDGGEVSGLEELFTTPAPFT